MDTKKKMLLMIDRCDNLILTLEYVRICHVCNLVIVNCSNCVLLPAQPTLSSPMIDRLRRLIYSVHTEGI